MALYAGGIIMSLSINVANNLKEDQNSFWKTNEVETKESKNSGTFFAGNLNQETDLKSRIEQRRQLAQNQAMKLVQNAWDSDQKISDGLKELDSLYEDKQKEKSYLSDQIADINRRKSELQKEYQIDPKSQEQKDLELLEEFQNRKSGVSFDRFSKEKIDRLSELQTIPRTEYQDRVLELNAQEGAFKKSVRDIDQEIININSSVRGTKLEQLKSKTMVNAQSASDAVLEQSDKEIFGLLIQEGKEAIDEKVEEEQKKAEELEAKKEEEKKILDKREEMRMEKQEEDQKEQESLIRNSSKTEILSTGIDANKQVTDHMLDAQKKIQKIMNENDLLEEDLKGIQIDFNY